MYNNDSLQEVNEVGAANKHNGWLRQVNEVGVAKQHSNAKQNANHELNENSKRAIHPTNVSFTLMGHQLAGIYAMAQLESTTSKYNKSQSINTKLGILGDSMATGKTHMVIAFLASDNNKKTKINKFYKEVQYINNFISIRKINKKQQLNTTIIITPTYQINYIKSILNQTKLKTCFIQTKKDIVTSTWTKNVDIIVCSNCKIKEFNSHAALYQFKRIIIHKADMIKLPLDMEWNGNFIWLMTNKPYEIFNSGKKYTRTLFNINEHIAIQPDDETFDYKNILRHIIVKNTNEHIEMFIKPRTPICCMYKCVLPKGFDIVDNVVSKNILELVSNNNIDEAIIKLKCNVNTNQSILQTVTQQLQQDIDEKKKKLALMTAHDSQYDFLCSEITSFETKFASIKERVLQKNDKYCIICFGEMTRPTVLSCCNHAFCFKCVMQLFKDAQTNKPQCPQCRTVIDFNNIHVIDNSNKLQQSIKAASQEKTKIEQLKELLDTWRDESILIIASSTDNVKHISNTITTTNTITTFKTFNNDTRTILIITIDELLQMQIHNIRHVMMMHKLTKDQEVTLSKKLYQSTNTVPLRLYYLLYENEIDKCTSNNFEIIL